MEFNIQGNVDFFVPYSVSKAAGNMVMAKYAARFKNDNFLFLSLCPGFVNTTSNYTLRTFQFLIFIMQSFSSNVGHHLQP